MITTKSSTVFPGQCSTQSQAPRTAYLPRPVAHEMHGVLFLDRPLSMPPPLSPPPCVFVCPVAVRLPSKTDVRVFPIPS